jgi:hypothetical protein
MWRSELTRSSLRPNHFRAERRALSWVGGIFGLLLILIGLALLGIYSNWLTSWAVANLPFSVSGIILVVAGIAIIIFA